MKKTPVILDVDTGIDDALALLYALSSETLDVLGVTTCFGNGDIDITTRNTLAVVDMAPRQTGVFQGAAHPLVGKWESSAEAFHGPTGLGRGPVPSPQSRIQAQTAAEFFIHTINERPGEVVIVTLARLTNIAAVLSANPGLAQKIPSIVVMGGAAFVGGNVTPVSEANIWGDPESAWVVFHSGVPITMVGLDVTMPVRISDRMLQSLDPHRPYSSLIRSAVDFYLGAYNPGAPPGLRTAPLHDPLAVAVAEMPALCRTELLPVDIELCGSMTRGMTVVDRREWLVPHPNVSVALDVDGPKFLRTFAQRLGFDPEL